MAPARLRAFLRKLRRDFPLENVRVRQRVMADCTGCTWKTAKGFEIWLHPSQPDPMLKDTLLHEVAHTLSWSEPLHHSARWAAKYAELTRWMQSEVEYAE